jgi:hypothetical protein
VRKAARRGLLSGQIGIRIGLENQRGFETPSQTEWRNLHRRTEPLDDDLLASLWPASRRKCCLRTDDPIQDLYSKNTHHGLPSDTIGSLESTHSATRTEIQRAQKEQP